MITIRNLSKSFSSNKGRLEVLKDISVDLPDKGITIINGKSGSGKTTFLNALGGLETYEGTITYRDGHVERGKASASLDSYRSLHIGYIFQNFLLFGEETVEENVKKSLDIAGIIDSKEKKKRIQGALKAVGLWLYRRRKAKDLSLGQKQRVAIARAIAVNPDILLADEPTGNLDSENANTVMTILKGLSQKIPVVCVTHNDNLSYLYGDHFFFMKDGKLTQGKKEDLDVSEDIKLRRPAFNDPAKEKLTVLEKVESFRILIINGLKKIILPKDYSSMSPQEADKALLLAKQSQEENNKKGVANELKTDAAQFDASSFDDSLKDKGRERLFGKRKHKGQKLVVVISFILAIILTFGLNSAFLYQDYSSNSLYALDRQTVGAIYSDGGNSSFSSNPISPLRQMELMEDPNSGIEQFLSPGMSIEPSDLVMEATNALNHSTVSVSPIEVYFLSNQAVSDSFALKGDKPSALGDHEVLMDESLVNNFHYYSKFGNDKSNYLNATISLDGSRDPSKQYKIVGFSKSNLPSFIFNASKEEVNDGIASYNAAYPDALEALNNMRVVETTFDPLYSAFDYYMSQDLYDKFMLYSDKYSGTPEDWRKEQPGYLTLEQSLRSVFPNLGNFMADSSSFVPASQPTLFIRNSAALEESSKSEISRFLLFLLNPGFYSVEVNSSGSNFRTGAVFFKQDVSPLSQEVITPTGTSSQNPNIYVRKDLYDLLNNQLNVNGRFSQDNPHIIGTYDSASSGALSYFASGEDVTLSLLRTVYPGQPFYNAVTQTYQLTSGSAVFIANDMDKVKALPSQDGFSYYDFGEIVQILSERNIQGRVMILVISIISALLILLYGLIYRSDMLLDSERIGVYRCLGVRKKNILLHYALFIAKKITLSFFLPYLLFVTLVVLMYQAYAPVYVLILVPILVYVLGLGIGLLPTILTLKKEPRLLVKTNEA